MKLTFIDVENVVRFINVDKVTRVKVTPLENAITARIVFVSSSGREFPYEVSLATLNGIYKKLEVIGV